MQLYHFPKAFMQPGRTPPQEVPGLRELADVISLHLYGCISACLSLEERRAMLAATEALLKKLDQAKGQAS
jgi:VanZ family protein